MASEPYKVSPERWWTGSRYRLYRLDDFGDPVCFAEAESPQGVGLAILTTAVENEDQGPVGILDAHSRRWIVGLWTSRKQTPFH